MRLLIFIITLLFTELLSAQTSDVIFRANFKFRVTINNTLQNSNYTNNIKIKDLKGEQHYNVVIDFENDSTILKKNIYLFDNDLTFLFEVSKKEFAIIKIIPYQLPNKDEDLMVISYTQNGEFILDNVNTDTTNTADTVYSPPFNSYYELENYNGKISCPWPIKSEELTVLKGIINAETIEDSKLEKIKDEILDADSMCIMVNQVSELIQLFQYEETKLEFAKFIAPSIFDINNIGKLETVFEFENSMDELKEYLNKK
jgi:hypothetical protein